MTTGRRPYPCQTLRGERDLSQFHFRLPSRSGSCPMDAIDGWGWGFVHSWFRGFDVVMT